MVLNFIILCKSFILIICFLISIFHLSTCVLYCKCNDHKKCRSTAVLGDFCTIKDKGHCFSAKIISFKIINNKQIGKINKRYGCLSTTTKSVLSCNGHYTNLASPVAIDCCNKTDYCNAKLNPQFYHHSSDEDAIKHAESNYYRFQFNVTPLNGGSNSSSRQIVVTNVTFMTICLVVLFMCLCIIVVLIFYCGKKLKWHIRASKQILRQTPNNLMTTIHHTRSITAAGNVNQHEEDSTATGIGVALLTTTHSKSPPTDSLMTASSSLITSTTIPSSGGGLSYQKLLTQRTIGHQILFREFLGKGRFSKIWAGELLGEMVTVKCLTASNNNSNGNNNNGLKILDEILWLRTIKLYYSCPLRHNAIVGLLGSDKIPPITGEMESLVEQYRSNELIVGCAMRPILIYPYFYWGTLARLMATSHWDLNSDNNQIGCTIGDSKLRTLTRMAFSLTAGLCYLHTEIAATKGKPAIAHRNLKSSNVYVKDDYSCCIGDLEWAYVSETTPCERGGLESHIITQPTTPNGLVHISDFEYYVSRILLPTECRYVAPELLESIELNGSQLHQFRTVDDYKKSDVYSLSLILWELLVWFEPQLKCPAYQSHSAKMDSTDPITRMYEPAYQSELIKLRQSQTLNISQYNDEPMSSEMRFIVIDQLIRPYINYQSTSNQWPSIFSTSNTENIVSNNSIVDLLCQILPQCWCSSPDSRLTSLKIKKYISELQDALILNSEDV